MSRFEKALLLSPLFVIAAYLVLPAPLRVALGHFVLLAAPATAALFSALAARRAARGAVLTWVLLATAAGCVALSQVVWGFRQLVLQQPMTFPSLSFYLIVAFHPLFAAALLLSLREGGHNESRTETLQDALLAAAAIALALLRFVFEPWQDARPWLTYSELIWIVGAQFLAQLSLVAALTVVIWRRTVLPPRAAAGLVLVALANGIANLLQVAGLDPDSSSPGNLFDIVWLPGWVIFAAAAVAGASAEASAWTGRTAEWVSMRLRQSVAPLVAVAMTVTAVDIALTGGASRETVVALTVVGGLLALRLAATLGAADREQRKQKELVRTRVLVELSRTLAGAPRVDDALAHVAAAARTLLDGRRVWFERLEDDGVVRITPAEPAGPDVRLPAARSCGAWLGDDRVAQCLAGDEFRALGPEGLPLPPRVWIACAAVRFGDHVSGALIVQRDDRGFETAELELLGALADQAAFAMENARLVDEARQAERVRLRHEKLASLGQLAAGVAHEINNPLTAIHTAAAMLAADRSDSDTADIIRSEAARAAAIVRGMLDFVRPPESSVGAVAVGELVRTLMRPRAARQLSRGISVYMQLDGVPPVLADGGQLAQVFLNLIDNAERALDEAAGTRALIVSGRTDGSAVMIDVHDTGSGIAPENLGRVFDPFFTTRQVGQGTGLGLSISYGVIRELGGSLSVSSVPGQGTTFTVRLPQAPQAAATTTAAGEEPATAAPPGGHASGGNSTFRVLLVDDEPSIRTLVSRFLRRRGHAVATAANGVEALAALETEDFDVVLTDLKMPVMDGVELYNRLKQAHPGAAQRVLFVSGDTVADSTREFLAQTGRPFISKPFALEELADLLGQVAAPRT